MNTSLTTFDGYPRNDIDVAQIRTTRARIIRLRNDYKSVMQLLEARLHDHFAAGQTLENGIGARDLSGGGGGSLLDHAVVSSNSQSRSVLDVPFAKVDDVVANSPAAQAGLRSGDRIVKFGPANATNHERLQKVAQTVQQNENVRDSNDMR